MLIGVNLGTSMIKAAAFSLDGESLAEVIKMLGDAGVRSLVSQPPTLEELFLRHYDISDTGDTASDESQQVSA